MGRQIPNQSLEIVDSQFVDSVDSFQSAGIAKQQIPKSVGPQIQNRLSETVDSQTVDFQTVDCQVSDSPDSEPVARDCGLLDLRLYTPRLLTPVCVLLDCRLPESVIRTAT